MAWLLSNRYIFMAWYLDKHMDIFTFTLFCRTYQRRNIPAINWK